MGYAEPNGKFKNGKQKWRARWQLPERQPNGRHKTDSKDGFTRKSDAEKYANDQEAAIRAGTYISPDAGKITIAEYFDQWLSIQKLRPGTKDTYRLYFNRVIKPQWGTTSISDIRTVPLMQWMAALNDPDSASRLAKSSLRIVGAILNGMFDLAVFEDRIRKNPIPPKAAGSARDDDYKEERVGQVFTRDEFAELLHRMPTWGHVLFCITALFTGLRWSETAAVCRKDLALNLSADGGAVSGTYRVDPKLGAVKRDGKSAAYLGPPKSGGGRIIDLPPFLVLLFADWLTRIPEAQQQLFVQPQGGLLRYGDFITDVWRPACDGRPAYITPKGRNAYPAILPACPGKNPHDLKHTAKAIMNDKRVHEVMQNYVLAHAEHGSSRAYKHPTPQMRAERVVALQETWEAWAIDLTALPAWERRQGPGLRRPTRLAPAVTPALPQTAQEALF